MASLKIVENLRKKAVKNFMDILILTEIKKRALRAAMMLSVSFTEDLASW